MFGPRVRGGVGMVGIVITEGMAWPALDLRRLAAYPTLINIKAGAGFLPPHETL